MFWGCLAEISWKTQHHRLDTSLPPRKPGGEASGTSSISNLVNLQSYWTPCTPKQQREGRAASPSLSGHPKNPSPVKVPVLTNTL